MFSAIWIVVANSWQQTPTAYTIEMTDLGPRARITSFWEMVFNPSSMDRLGHVLLGAFITGAMLVASVSAYYLLKGRHLEFAKKSMSIAVWIVAVVSTLQMVSGHISTEHVAVNQPTKFAAMEGHMDASKPLEVSLLGLYNEESQSVHGIMVPGMIDLLLSQEDQVKSLEGRKVLEAKAAEQGAKSAYPSVQAVYQFFHGMILIGIVLFAMGWLAVALLPKGRLFETRWLLKAFVPAVALPHLANQFGWMTAELGRMPWTVYGLQTTTQGVSPKVDAPEIVISLLMFTLMYALLGALFVYLLNKRFMIGPVFTGEVHSAEVGKAAMSPLEAMNK
jgi:cytochrome d ubiquinol oxidase subunit I